MSIPNEAVEAAAKAFIEHGTLLPALEAAAPYILAPVLALADHWQEDFPYKANQLRAAVAPITNPSRSTP